MKYSNWEHLDLPPCEYLMSYCWWNQLISISIVYPIIYRFFYIPGGAIPHKFKHLTCFNKATLPSIRPPGAAWYRRLSITSSESPSQKQNMRCIYIICFCIQYYYSVCSLNLIVQLSKSKSLPLASLDILAFSMDLKRNNEWILSPWLVNRDPYNGLLQSPYNWVV